jgi:hypothetical protein
MHCVSGAISLISKIRGYKMRSEVNSKISRFILITGLIIFLILVMVTPVSAELRTIKQGATIFIGEGNLDITNGVGSSNTIGWWASPYALNANEPPTKTLNIVGRQTAFTVAPADFVSCTGNWYLLNSDGATVQKGTNGYPIAAFIVADPTLAIAPWDFSLTAGGQDQSGRSVVQGQGICFKVDTNMYAAVNPQYRPNVNSATDGYINIIVRDVNGVTVTSLYNSGSTSIPLINQFVNAQPYYWGNSANNWYTDALDPNGQYRYPSGTYTVWAESTLNNMRDNYKNAGADYTGKTTSARTTITLVSDSVKIEANQQFVVRGEGQSFSISITANPSSTVDVYIDNGDVSGITPPTLVTESYSTLISPGHIQTQLPTSGTRVMRFTTSQQTTPKVYNFKVVSLKPKVPTAQVNVEVLAIAPTPTPIPTQSIGSIVVQSSPTGASIFLDNAIKGITPLTIQSIPNGAHVVLLRLNGYQDSSNSINVQGGTQTINPTLAPIGITTTGATTIPTTASVTATTTTGTTITELTTTVTTATPRPTAKVNLSATIATMQSQIADQKTKIEEQGSWIDQILRFLGLK